MKTIESLLEQIDNEVEIEFKDEKAKKTWEQLQVANKNDSFGLSIINFASIFAKYMQLQIKSGKEISEIAENSFFDVNIDGLSDFYYCFAICLLGECWRYGDELVDFHKSIYGM